MDESAFKIGVVVSNVVFSTFGDVSVLLEDDESLLDSVNGGSCIRDSLGVNDGLFSQNSFSVVLKSLSFNDGVLDSS